MRRVLGLMLFFVLVVVAGGGRASAGDAQARSSGLAHAIDRAVRTGQPVASQPELAAVVTVDANGVPQGSIDGYSIAEVQDLVAVAKQYKKDGAEVVAQAEHERAYLPVYKEAMRSDSFAGGELGHDGGESWIGFQGEAPAQLDEAATKAGIAVRERLPRSRASLEALQDRVHRAASSGGKADTLSWIDESSMRIKVHTNLSEDAVSEDIARALSTPTDALSKDMPVDVVHVDDPVAVNEDHVRRGGGHSAECTVGFILRSKGSGTKRLGTAGHCVNPGTTTTYVNHPVDASSPTSIGELWRHEGSSGTWAISVMGGNRPWRPSIGSGTRSATSKRLRTTRRTTPQVSCCAITGRRQVA